ncbi:hypothetical protein CIPAW_11G146000 [Carya illinoinensis]|uniref:Uncharacterized protein n=1 Tax=Carya illinoinensis TaxID=32201 RepID=A0A8T1NXL7_CARIL|nr:hypothetical protein CIPAW_11G146000 [Carya illinoinensis]
MYTFCAIFFYLIFVSILSLLRYHHHPPITLFTLPPLSPYTLIIQNPPPNKSKAFENGGEEDPSLPLLRQVSSYLLNQPNPTNYSNFHHQIPHLLYPSSYVHKAQT